MQLTGLEKDAVNLCNRIYDTMLPTEKWAVINIAISNNSTFTYPLISSIPLSFGYTYEKVPLLLKQFGAIEFLLSNRWFQNIRLANEQLRSLKENNKILTAFLLAKGYINKNQEADLYLNRFEKNKFGPIAKGQYVAVINRYNMINFVHFYSGQYPVFNIKTGNLFFLNETIQIDGDLQRKSFKYLIDNINSLVSKKEFYEIESSNNYEAEVKIISQSSTSDKLKKRLEAIEKKVNQNTVLSHALVFKYSKDGIGIFINQRALTTPPNKDK